MLNQSQRSTNPLWLNSANSQKYSVGTKFKAQLFRLMQRLEHTNPHFIRCIKPNSKQLPCKFENDVVLEQLRCCGVLEVVRISRSGYPTRFTHQQFADRFGFLLLEDVDFQDPLSVSIAILHQFNILPEMYQVGYTKLFFRSGQIAVLENARKVTIERIVRVQNRYRGIQTRRHFQKLKKGAIILQSYIRGYLARKEFFILKSNGMIKFYHGNINGVAQKNLQEGYITGYPQVQALALAESRALQAEAFLKQKEDECAALRKKLQLSEIRCYEIDIKMKLKEEMWQKEMTSLQLSLAAKTTQPFGRPDASPVHHNYDSEDGLSNTMHTPEATPPRQPPGSAGAHARGYDGSRGTVAHLAKEFEQQIQVFEDDVRLIGHLKPEDELQNLKVRFYAWNKDYKARLRETKAALRKSGLSQGDKTRKKWWLKRAIRI